jgi:hypothetical protein
MHVDYTTNYTNPFFIFLSQADPAELERMELPALQELEVALQQSLKVVTARKGTVC